MSVTFSAYSSDGTELAPEGWQPTFEDNAEYGRIQTNQNPWELNVANGNFCRIMELLGFPGAEYCGTFGDGSLQDLQERVTFALQSLIAVPALDTGRPTEETRTKNGGRWIECGTDDGYFTERLTQLSAIIQAAIDAEGMVNYG
jgi:hypothetical protein